MARPKRTEGETTAKERIIGAFWQLLSERPYDRITIAALSERAEVNHNLIYYYFENIDDLAMRAFRKNMDDGEPQRLLAALLSGNADMSGEAADPARIEAINRLRLFMRDDSAYLNRLAKEAILSEWLQYTGRSSESLTVGERIDLDFIISGVVGILGSLDIRESPTVLAGIASRPLGQGIADTLRGLAGRGKISY